MWGFCADISDSLILVSSVLRTLHIVRGKLYLILYYMNNGREL
jgi:hypothetical protein